MADIDNEKPGTNNKGIYSYWMTKKLQMSTFLQDLHNGESFSNAMTKLQTMGALMEQVIQENIDLYDDLETDQHTQAEQQDQPMRYTGNGDSGSDEQNHCEEEISTQHRSRSNTNKSMEHDHKEEDLHLFNDVVIPKDKEYQEILESITTDIPEGLHDDQQILRMKIQKIQCLTDISPKIKSLMIQKMMMGKTELTSKDLRLLDRRSASFSISSANTPVPGSKQAGDKEEVVPTISQDDFECTFSDPYGCEHYLRNCVSQCATCNKWEMCNFCHDEKDPTHSMERNKVQWIACLYCLTVQHPDSQFCVNKDCNKQLSSYFCDICKLYDNDEEKDIYHCKKCGICRIGLGLGLDYFHCDTCQACMPIELFDFNSDDEEDKEENEHGKLGSVNTSTTNKRGLDGELIHNDNKSSKFKLSNNGKDVSDIEADQDNNHVSETGNALLQDNVLNDVIKIIGNTTSQSLLSIFEYAQQDRLKLAAKQHICIDGNTKSSCPICGEYMFTSMLPVMYMQPCAHAIHKHCFDEYTKHSYKCPVCQVTIIDMEIQFKILDQEIQEQPLPEPYNEWKCVYKCNDCNARGICQYHILGLKCGGCYSFNTVQLKLIKKEENVDEELRNLDDYKNQIQPQVENSFGTTNKTVSTSNTSNTNSNNKMIENIVNRNKRLLKGHFSTEDSVQSLPDYFHGEANSATNAEDSDVDSIGTNNDDDDNGKISGANPLHNNKKKNTNNQTGDNIDNFMNAYLKDDEDLKFSNLAQGFKIYLTKYYNSVAKTTTKQTSDDLNTVAEKIKEPELKESIKLEDNHEEKLEEEQEEEKEEEQEEETSTTQKEETSISSVLMDLRNAFSDFMKQQRQLGEDLDE